jgi:hypothetical protein
LGRASLRTALARCANFSVDRDSAREGHVGCVYVCARVCGEALGVGKAVGPTASSSRKTRTAQQGVPKPAP